jgi:hypothetical protein
MVTCKSPTHLKSFFDEACNNRPLESCAEGVVLRDPTAWYFKRDSFWKKEVAPFCFIDK